MDCDVLVGFGINPEVSARYKSGLAQKLPARISMQVAGTSVNIAQNLVQWGRPVTLIGAIGSNCPYQDFLVKALEEKGVSHLLLPIKEATSVAVVTLPEDGPVQILSDKSRYFAKPYTQIREHVASLKPRFAVATGVTLDDWDLAEAMFVGNGRDTTTVLNPRRSLVECEREFSQLLPNVDILAVNEDEFCGFSGNGHVTFEDMRAIHGLGPKIVLVTRDARGAMLTTKDGKNLEQSAIKFDDMIDEVGAGDCFLSYFIHGQLLGFDLEKSMKLAAIAAGIKVTRVGGSNVPATEEIIQQAVQHGLEF